MTENIYKNDGSLKQKYTYIPKSIKRMSKKLRENSIKPNEVKGDLLKTYSSIRKQFHDLSLQLSFEKQREREREESLNKFCLELRKYNIKPDLVREGKNNEVNIHRSYLKVRRQWENLRKDFQSDKYPQRLIRQNKINKERYRSSPTYRNNKKKQSTKQYLNRVDYVKKLEEENKKFRRILKNDH